MFMWDIKVGYQMRKFSGTLYLIKPYWTLLQFPKSMLLPGREMYVPYIFLADDAFPLTENIIKPTENSTDLSVGYPKRVCNYRISRT